jgi:hypothetical protein
MKFSSSNVKLRCGLFVAAAFSIAGSGCSAMSRIGAADVRDVDGTPCFAVSTTSEAGDAAIKLFALAVSDPEQRRDWQSLPAPLWAFEVVPKGSWITTTARNCVRYGETPQSAVADPPAKPLQPKRVYVVFIEARRADGAAATLGYEGAFCLRLGPAGKPTVHAVPWDKNAQRWQSSECDGER